MLNISAPIQKFGLEEIGTVDGVTPKLLFGGNTKPRQGVEIHNADPTYSLWVNASEKSNTPNVSSTDRTYIIPPLGTLQVRYGDGILVAILNSSGSTTTSSIKAREVSA